MMTAESPKTLECLAPWRVSCLATKRTRSRDCVLQRSATTCLILTLVLCMLSRNAIWRWVYRLVVHCGLG
eukprot:5126622-Amphidinium_carterae.1